VTFLRAGPIKAWGDRKDASGQPWFRLQGDTLHSGEGIRGGARIDGGAEAFQGLVAELIEWRIAEYLSRRVREAVLDVGRNATGEPILKLNRKQYELPKEWVLIASDSGPYRVQYQNHSVAQATRPEGTENELGALLKGWFGDDAGARGAKHQVVQKTDAKGNVHWKPRRPIQIVDDDGKDIDATFDCEDFEGEPTIVFHARSGQPVKNRDYGPGLEVLLARLGRSNVQITRIAVESRDTRVRPLKERILQIDGFDYPINVSAVEDLKELRTRIGRTAATTGRERGAKGSGNSTKRLRIWVDRPVEEEPLARDSAGTA